MIAAGPGSTPGLPFVLAALIFAVIVVLVVFGLADTVYGRRGSGIDQHPQQGDAPSGEGRDAGNQATSREEFNETFGDRSSR